jgi:hypothetical protein
MNADIAPRRRHVAGDQAGAREHDSRAPRHARLRGLAQEADQRQRAEGEQKGRHDEDDRPPQPAGRARPTGARRGLAGTMVGAHGEQPRLASPAGGHVLR